jgi:hypothetical protein
MILMSCKHFSVCFVVTTSGFWQVVLQEINEECWWLIVKQDTAVFSAQPQYHNWENYCIPHNESNSFADGAPCNLFQYIPLLGWTVIQRGKKKGINCTIKINTESRWYALILQALSVVNYMWAFVLA